MILADQGADVIKVENPDGGDHTRAANNRRNGFSASFLNNNRNKRSIALDLKDRSRGDVLRGCSLRPTCSCRTSAPAWPTAWAWVRSGSRRRAGIIYVSISGFGETGPYAQKPVYDPLIQAVSGLATIQAGSDTERPRLVRTIVPDKLTASSRRRRSPPRCSRANVPARASMSGCRCWTPSLPFSGPPTWAARPSSARKFRSRKPPALST